MSNIRDRMKPRTPDVLVTHDHQRLHAFETFMLTCSFRGDIALTLFEAQFHDKPVKALWSGDVNAGARFYKRLCDEVTEQRKRGQH